MRERPSYTVPIGKPWDMPNKKLSQEFILQLWTLNWPQPPELGGDDFEEFDPPRPWDEALWGAIPGVPIYVVLPGEIWWFGLGDIFKIPELGKTRVKWWKYAWEGKANTYVYFVRLAEKPHLPAPYFINLRVQSGDPYWGKEKDLKALREARRAWGGIMTEVAPDGTFIEKSYHLKKLAGPKVLERAKEDARAEKASEVEFREAERARKAVTGLGAKSNA